MEFIAEIVLQLVFELIGDLLINAGSHGAARVWSSKAGRFVLGVVFNVGGAVLVGYLWGRHVYRVDPANTPTSVWVSLGLAAAFALAAVVLRSRMEELHRRPGWIYRFADAAKLWWMVLFNVVLAGAIAWGFYAAKPALLMT